MLSPSVYVLWSLDEHTSLFAPPPKHCFRDRTDGYPNSLFVFYCVPRLCRLVPFAIVAVETRQKSETHTCPIPHLPPGHERMRGTTWWYVLHVRTHTEESEAGWARPYTLIWIEYETETCCRCVGACGRLLGGRGVVLWCLVGR